METHRIYRYLPEMLFIDGFQLLPKSLLSPSLAHPQTSCRLATVSHCEVVIVESNIHFIFTVSTASVFALNLNTLHLSTSLHSLS